MVLTRDKHKICSSSLPRFVKFTQKKTDSGARDCILKKIPARAGGKVGVYPHRREGAILVPYASFGRYGSDLLLYIIVYNGLTD